MEAVFEKDGKELITRFGAVGYKDYTMYSMDEREAKKKAYIARHAVNEDWSDPTKAGTLARYVLWNKPTIVGSIEDFIKRFKL
jgi:hypothetical protein